MNQRTMKPLEIWNEGAKVKLFWQALHFVGVEWAGEWPSDHDKLENLNYVWDDIGWWWYGMGKRGCLRIKSRILMVIVGIEGYGLCMIGLIDNDQWSQGVSLLIKGQRVGGSKDQSHRLRGSHVDNDVMGPFLSLSNKKSAQPNATNPSLYFRRSFKTHPI